MDNVHHNLIAQKKFFNLLDAFLSQGLKAYQDYIDNERTFFYANIILKNNQRILELILEHVDLFNAEQKNDLLRISFHIQTWLAQWNFLCKTKDFELEDEFVFQTDIKFPKNSLKRLDSYFYENFSQRFRN